MGFWIGLAIGILSGFFIGVIIISLLCMSSRGNP